MLGVLDDSELGCAEIDGSWFGKEEGFPDKLGVSDGAERGEMDGRWLGIRLGFVDIEGYWLGNVEGEAEVEGEPESYIVGVADKDGVSVTTLGDTEWDGPPVGIRLGFVVE